MVCCPTRLHPACRAALPPGTDIVRLSRFDPFAYWRALGARWAHPSGLDLVVIEHDIEIHGKVMPSFAMCDSAWCTFPYRQRPDYGFWCTSALGCTRFSGALQAVVPWPAEPVAWESLDGVIARALIDDRGMAPCVHDPEVTHHAGPAGTGR